MRKILKIVILSLVLFISNPLFSVAQIDRTGGGSGTGLTYECKKIVNGTDVYGECDYDDLILAVKKFFNVATPLALAFSVVVIAYAGFLYMTSGSNASKRTKANEMFVKIAWGVFFMLGAWVIVTLITNSLLNVNVNTLVPLK